MNQINVSMGLQAAYSQGRDWKSAVARFSPGMDQTSAGFDFFRAQFGQKSDLYHPGTTFYKSNTFNAPFQPFRKNVRDQQLAGQRSPGALYALGDLQDSLRTNLLWDFLVPVPTASLGVLSTRYEPWGKSRDKSLHPAISAWEIGAKDPVPVRLGTSGLLGFCHK